MAISVAYSPLSFLERLVLTSLGRSPGMVLCYHGVLPEKTAGFRRQLEILRRWTVPIEEEGDRPFSLFRPLTLVTFDDGLESTFKNAFPILRELNIPSVVFIPAGMLGSPCSWITLGKNFRDREQRDRDRVASRETIMGSLTHLVSLGSHGSTHRPLKGLPEGEMAEEMAGSKKQLELLMARPVVSLSFPRGLHDHRSISLAREAGFRAVYSIVPKFVPWSSPPVLRGRVVVEPEDSAFEFFLKIQGAYNWKRWFPLKARVSG